MTLPPVPSGERASARPLTPRTPRGPKTGGWGVRVHQRTANEYLLGLNCCIVYLHAPTIQGYRTSAVPFARFCSPFEPRGTWAGVGDWDGSGTTGTEAGGAERVSCARCGAALRPDTGWEWGRRGAGACQRAGVASRAAGRGGAPAGHVAGGGPPRAGALPTLTHRTLRKRG